MDSMNTYSVLGNAYSVLPPSTESASPGTLIGNVGNMSMDQINQVAQNFESMFISEMLSPMFDGLDGTDAFGGAESGDVYKGMMMDEYGKQIARSGGIGIADYVRKELLKLQEGTNPASAKAAQGQQKQILRNRYRDSQDGLGE